MQISAEDKFKLKQVCVEEFKNLEPEHDTDKTQENSASDKVIGNFENLAIDKNDLIELELLADDFDDSENFQEKITTMMKSGIMNLMTTTKKKKKTLQMNYCMVEARLRLLEVTKNRTICYGIKL